MCHLQVTHPLLVVPRTGLEPARLAARAPETRASTIPPPGHEKRDSIFKSRYERKTRLDAFVTLSSFHSASGKRDSNSRPQPWQGCALPTELFPPDIVVKRRRLELPRLAALPPQSSASTNSATSPTILSFQEIQLSFQIAVIAIPLNCVCKGTAFFEICKII